MGEIAKFFSGGKSGPKALLLAYAKFGKDTQNKYFKQREPSYNFTSRNIKRDKMSEAAQKDLLKKNVGGMAEAMEKGAKSQFKTKKNKTVNKKLKAENMRKARFERKRELDERVAKMQGVFVPISPFKKPGGGPITEEMKIKKKKPGVIKMNNGGMASKRTSRRAGIAKRGFNNFKGIF